VLTFSSWGKVPPLDRAAALGWAGWFCAGPGRARLGRAVAQACTTPLPSSPTLTRLQGGAAPRRIAPPRRLDPTTGSLFHLDNGVTLMSRKPLGFMSKIIQLKRSGEVCKSGPARRDLISLSQCGGHYLCLAAFWDLANRGDAYWGIRFSLQDPNCKM